MLVAPAPPPRKLTPPRPLWLPVDSPDPDVVARLAAELRLPPPICRLLAQRGFADPARARAFLKPHPGHLHPPGLLAGIADGVDRLARAVRRGETILIHGDYDVDGISSTALLVRALAMMGGRAVPFVPDRLRDGYDLTAGGIAAARRAGATLIVTVDCGIVAHEAVAAAARVGVDVIVSDHHAPAATLPAATAVINPNRSDCGYPEKGLAGAGVAFKLVQALAEEIGFPVERLNSLLDLVALATVADLAPLTPENRALVRWGLSVLARTPNPGVRALLRSSGLGAREEITAGQVGFILAPRLNAAGRLGDAMRGVRLLLTDSALEAARLADELEVENRRRRELDEETLRDVVRMLETDYDPDRHWGVVLASDRWHPGIVGIVASRVVELVHRPVVLIALGGREGKGSGRSIPGLHLQRTFAQCAEHLIRFGGHRAAAGCSIEPDRVGAFRAAFDAAVSSALAPEALQPKLRVDALLSLAEANRELLRFLRHFAPFGIGNPTPIFAVHDVRLERAPRVVGSGHLRLALTADGTSLEAIGFGMAGRIAECAGRRIDVAFKLEENSWKGRNGLEGEPTLQARLVDFRPTG